MVVMTNDMQSICPTKKFYSKETLAKYWALKTWDFGVICVDMGLAITAMMGSYHEKFRVLESIICVAPGYWTPKKRTNLEFVAQYLHNLDKLFICPQHSFFENKHAREIK